MADNMGRPVLQMFNSSIELTNGTDKQPILIYFKLKCSIMNMILTLDRILCYYNFKPCHVVYLKEQLIYDSVSDIACHPE